MIKIGSLFSGIGGFELGLERAIPNSKTIWQVEQNKFCQKVLKKHWPKAKIYDDVKNITAQNVEPIDLLCGGFPCQDISQAGKMRGINEGKKSSLWWTMLRIISELEPKIVILENVLAIIPNGGSEVVGSLASIGYNCEWSIISARQFGAPHIRKRWFCVAYPNMPSNRHGTTAPIDMAKSGINSIQKCHWRSYLQSGENNPGPGYWKKISGITPIHRLDDGFSRKVDRHRRESILAYGNAIVPQCSEYIGLCILQSGLLERNY